MTTRRRPARPRTLGRAVRRTLRALIDAYLSASAELAWAQAYGPGFAPTAPIRFSRPLPRPAYRVRPAPAAAPRGGQQSDRRGGPRQGFRAGPYGARRAA